MDPPKQVIFNLFKYIEFYVIEVEVVLLNSGKMSTYVVEITLLVRLQIFIK